MTSAEPGRAWRGFGASATGTSHAERGGDCEDAHALIALDGGGLVIAVADGAGSARCSQRGAWIAVEAAAEVAAAVASAGETEPARAGIEAARRALEATVAADGESAQAERASGDDPGDGADDNGGEGGPLALADLACTLLVAVLIDDRVDAAQVGDGAVIVRRGGRLAVMAAGERGEFLNETCFVTSTGWAEELHTESADEVDAVAVMTDGLQLLALDMTTGQPHAAFFDPLLSWAAGSKADGRDLVLFLGSEKVNARTDDDKTLALAVLVDDK